MSARSPESRRRAAIDLARGLATDLGALAAILEAGERPPSYIEPESRAASFVRLAGLLAQIELDEEQVEGVAMVVRS